jgi:TatA/E family protein of Tat protein translocase
MGDHRISAAHGGGRYDGEEGSRNVILVIALILFGGSRLQELARSLGSSIREFDARVGPKNGAARDV